MCSLQVHPGDADVLFAAYADGSVYVSEDAGERWRQLNMAYPKAFGARVCALE